jgi:hypothetical protein
LGARRRRGEAREQCGRIPILVGIDHAERNRVAFEEVRQPRHVRGLECPDEHRTSEAELDQRHSTQDERAQDALAELGLGDEQGSQRLRRNNDRLDVTDGSGVEHAQVRPSGELTDLGKDLARDRLRHFLDRCPEPLRERFHWHRLPESIARLDRYPAGQDHVHPGDGLSCLEYRLLRQRIA